MIQDFLALFDNPVFLKTLSVFFSTAPVWLPLLLAFVLWELFYRYVRMKYLIGMPHVLLEIKLPQDIKRSPLAMETVLNVMYHTGEPANWYEQYVEGRYRPEFSLEIASFEGEVHFFVRCRAKHKNIVEAQIYSQYPDVEIVEVPDYAEQIQYDEKTMNLFGLEHKLSKPDPYPIKTYVDFGLDREQEEEFQIDPINSILEFMSTFGKGEYCFLQFIIRSHIPEKKIGGEKKLQDWQHEARKEAARILKRDPETFAPLSAKEGFFSPTVVSDEEKKLADAVLRNIAKKPFDTGSRMIYFADKEHYKNERNSGLPTVFRSFESHSLNNLKPVFRTQICDDVYKPFLDPFGWRAAGRKRELYKAYRWRSFFKPPIIRPKFVMSAEEIATLYHFPGRATTAPGLPRITSKRGAAPSNLPL